MPSFDTEAFDAELQKLTEKERECVNTMTDAIDDAIDEMPGLNDEEFARVRDLVFSVYQGRFRKE